MSAHDGEPAEDGWSEVIERWTADHEAELRRRWETTVLREFLEHAPPNGDHVDYVAVLARVMIESREVPA